MKKHIFTLMLLAVIVIGGTVFQFAGILEASPANPGHSAAEISAGAFESGTFSFPDNVGFGTASIDANYRITTAGGGIKAESTDWPAGYFSSASGYGLIVNSGNVGIGTTAPGAKLEVAGYIKSNATKVRAALSANQSVASGAWTKVNFDSETFDALGEYDNTTNFRFTASTAGYYHVVGTIYFRLGVSGELAQLKLVKNGATDLNIVRNGSVESGDAEFSLVIDDIIYLGVNDYLEWYAWHNSATTPRSIYASPRSWMAIVWVP